MDDVKAFFAKYYCPSNAILCIAGNFELQEIKDLVKKWYGGIPSGKKPERNISKEVVQIEFREEILEREVPSDAFYYAFKMCDRKSKDYYVFDIISDALGGDKSSRLYNVIQKKLKLVTDIQSYITGSLDEGLFLISGKIAPGKTFEELDQALWLELNKLKDELIPDLELNRLKNKIQTSKEFQEQGLLNRAMSLSYYELLGNPDAINDEQNAYASISSSDFKRVANTLFDKNKCSLLKVKSIENAK